MKHILLAILLFPAVLQAQKLEQNKKDEFTGTQVQRTSYEVLLEDMTNRVIFFRISKLDSLLLLDAKIILGGKVFSINEGDELMFKLDSGAFVKLKSIEHEISSKGGGARGINHSGVEGVTISYKIMPEDFELLKSQNITKFRLYTSDGYIEKDVKDNRRDILKNELALIQ